MPKDYRSGDRATAISFRMTTEEREQLHREVVEGGYTSLQQLLEARVFGAPKPRRKSGPQPQAERLDLSA